MLQYLQSKSKIHRIPNLTPGDFKVIRQKNFFNELVPAKNLIDQLEIGSSYKKVARPIGLAIFLNIQYP